MARIALIDPIGRAVTTVEAVLGRSHDIVVRPRIHAPGDVELVIADLRPAELADQATLRSLASFGPVLLLVDRSQPIPPAVEESAELNILRKPFDAFELRLRVDKLLEIARTAGDGAHAAAVPGRDHEDETWLEFPFVPAPAGAVLRRGARLTAPLWILGEPGCGRRRVALAVCGIGRPAPRVVTLYADQRLEDVLLREHGGDPYALIVPEIEQRSLVEQERLASMLAGPRDFRLICTSIDDPAEAVVAGEFSRSLYQHLIGLAVQIQPLRERPITIPPLVQALSRSIVRSLGCVGEVSFSPDAMARLQTYMWPGNLTELESVLVRTLTTVGEIDSSGRTIGAEELLFTPDDTFGSRGAGRIGRTGGDISRLPIAGELSRFTNHSDDSPAETAAEPRRTIRWPNSDRADEVEQAAVASREPEAEPARGHDSIEQIVVGLAHDLRNPMVAIKTFAGVLAAGEAAGDSAKELGTMASEACDRIGSHLEALQEYSDFDEPKIVAMDLLESIRGVVAEMSTKDSKRVRVEVEGEAPIRGDRDQLRFVVENLLEAALSEGADGEVVRVYTTQPTQVPRVGPAPSGDVASAHADALVFEVATGKGPVAKLRKFVRSDDGPPSWRVLLARTLAERNGCGVDVELAEDTVKILCRLPGGEEETRGEQTSRFNR
jgi:DNA-binding NtrC family response regulator